MSDDLQEKLFHLGTLVARLRTVPHRSSLAEPEGPGRITQQLANIVDNRVILDERTKWTQSDYQLATKIARDTLHPNLLRLISYWYRPDAKKPFPLTRDQLRTWTGLGFKDLDTQLKQWAFCELLEPVPNKGWQPTADCWESLTLTELLSSANLRQMRAA